MTAHERVEDAKHFQHGGLEGGSWSASEKLSLELSSADRFSNEVNASDRFPLELGLPHERLGRSLCSRRLYEEAGARVARLADSRRYPPRKVSWPFDGLQEFLEESDSPPCSPTSNARLRQTVEGPVRCDRRLQRSISLPALKLLAVPELASPPAPSMASSALPAISSAAIRAEVDTPSMEVISGASYVFNSTEETVIIFDWDDTLFPTWFVSEVVLPCLAEDSRSPTTTGSPLPDDCPFLEALNQHAVVVGDLLRSASAVGRVSIVTLSQRPWVVNSAKRFLPGLHLEELLKELRIPIVYARESIKRPMVCLAEVEEGVNVFSVAKQRAMAKALKKLYGKAPWRNIISIGDSRIERDAIKELIWGVELPESNIRPPCCKTVKLMEEPSLEQLGAELGLLRSWLRTMVSYSEDFDVVVDNSEDSLRGLHSMFGS